MTAGATGATPPAARITAIEPVCVNVSAKTNWFFVRVVDDAERVGWGEASINGYEPLLEVATRMAADTLRGQSLAHAIAWARVFPHDAGGLVSNAVKSAIELAAHDLLAQSAGVPLHALVGERRRDRVPAYANINRRTSDRSASGCAASARAALADGWKALKIAPFDGVVWEDLGTSETQRRIAAGIERVAAIREAVGPGVPLMVDCHWRFDVARATTLVRELAPLALGWIECPISEAPGFHAANRSLRDLCHAHGTRLAAAELQVGVSGFAPLVEGGLFDVVMPDVKYVGGVAEALRVDALCARHGIGFSPHNPTGPICHAASVHVSTCAAAFEILEVQVGESALFDALVGGGGPRFVDGAFEPSSAPGLGVAVDLAVARAHPFRPVAPGLDPRLG